MCHHFDYFNTLEQLICRYVAGVRSPKSREAEERPRSRSAPALLRSPKNMKKRKQWTEESMQAALGAVQSGVSVLRAAREHGVPRQTL